MDTTFVRPAPAVRAARHGLLRRGPHESEEVALERGRLDAVIARFLFNERGMRRGARCSWAAITAAASVDDILVTRSRRTRRARRRTLKGAVTGAIRTLQGRGAGVAGGPRHAALCWPGTGGGVPLSRFRAETARAPVRGRVYSIAWSKPSQPLRP